MRLTMALLAGLGCCALGLSVSSAAARRLRMLRAGEQAIQAIRLGVCVRGELLPQVLLQLPKGATPEAQAWAQFWAGMGAALVSDPSVPLSRTWPQAWAAAERDHPALRALAEEDRHMLSPLIDGLGRTPRDEQQSLLSGVCADLSGRHEALEKKLADTQKIAQTLGMLGGLALFLLLV